MKKYRYEAMNPQGRHLAGTIEADSTDEANALLEQMKLEVRELGPCHEPGPVRPVTKAEFLLFNQQLAAITQAGIPLDKGLRKLSADVQSRRLRKLIDDLADDLEAGVPVDEAFEKHREQFPPMYGHLIRAGIRSGRLGEMLVSVSRHLELSSRSRRTLVEALTYPLIVLLVAAGVTAWLAIYILPIVREMLVSQGTLFGNDHQGKFQREALWASEWLPPILLGGLGFVVVLAVVWRLLKLSGGGRLIREQISMNIPLLGRICRSAAVSRFADAMSVVAVAQKHLPAALREAGAASGYESVFRDAAVLADALEQGRPLEDAGADCQVFSPLMVYSLARAAEQDDLPRRMHELSETHWIEAELNHARLRTVLAPLSVFLVGLLIGTLTMVIWMPMIYLLQQMQY